MISGSDGPIPGRKDQKPPADLTVDREVLTGARVRLGHLFDLDERNLIDLRVEAEARERGWT
jgi:hypothetical protein